MARTVGRRGLALIVLVVIVACSPAPTSTSPSAPSTGAAPTGVGSSSAPAGGTAFDAVVAMLGPEGEVSHQMALQAFALAVAPLPGVTPPEGILGHLDADAAVAWVTQLWDRLDSAQQQAIERALAAMPDPYRDAADVSATDPETILAAWPPRTAAAGPECGLFLADPEQVAAADIPSAVAPYIDMMRSATEAIAGHLRRPALPRHAVCLVTDGALAGTALTRVFDAEHTRIGLPASCSVYLNADAIGALDAGDLGFLMAYEAFLCFEATAKPAESIEAHGDRSRMSWVVMGGATWAAATVAVEVFGAVAPRVEELWGQYLTEPHVGLFQRTNDALGYFAQVDQDQPAAWDAMDAALAESGNSGPFDALTGRRQSFIDQWAAGFFRDARRGADWDIVGPGISTDTPEAGSIEIENGGAKEMAAPSMAVATADLSTSADVTTFASNHLRIHDGVQDLRNVRNQAYCTRDGGAGACTCPEGSPGAARAPLPTLGVEAKLALTGMEWGATVEIRGLSLEDYCGPQSSTAPVCSVGIPSGDYTGTLDYTTVTPYLRHEGSGQIRFTVGANDAVSGSWDVAYVSTSSSGQMGTGAVKDGAVCGMPRVLQLHGTNVVATSHGTGASVPWPATPLTVQPVCDGEVIAEYQAGPLTVTVHASVATP
ncbi:MAG: hypothetical protein ABIQ58_07725 [Candidatus Limnocylindrales bacterium]